MADLARLVVRLEADSLKLTKELDEAKRKLATFEKSTKLSTDSVKRAFAALAATGAVAGLVAATRSAIDLADATSKAAAKIGVTTEALSQLRYAAGLAGVESDKFDTSLLKLNRSLGEAAANSESKAARAFAALGVSVTNADGTLASADGTLEALADRFAGMEDGAAKTTLAMQLFGKSGADLIPLLNGGAEAMRAARAEADAFGQTVDGNAARAAEQFNDNLARLQMTLSGAMLQAAQQITPVLATMSDEMVAASRNAETMHRVSAILATGLKLLISAGVAVKTAFMVAGIALGGFAAAATQLVQLNFGQMVNIVQQASADIVDQLSGDAAFLEKLWTDAGDVAVASMGTQAKAAGNASEALRMMGDNAKRTADQQGAAIEQLRNMAQQLTQQVETHGMAEDAVIRYRLAQGDLAATLMAAGEAGREYEQTIVAMTDRMQELQALQEQNQIAQQVYNDALNRGRQITEAMRTPVEVYRDTIADLNSLLSQGAISQETYTRAVEQAGETLEETTNKSALSMEQITENLARNIQGTLADFLFDPFKDGTDGMLDAFSNVLRKMAAEVAAAAIMEQLFGVTGGGKVGGGGLFGQALGAIGGFFGARANGGPINAGQPYLVGERGPELVIPNANGHVMNAHETAGMGGRSVNMTVVTPDADSFRKSARQVTQTVRRGLT